MFKKVYSLYSAFYPSLRFTLSLQSAVRSLRFTLTGYKHCYLPPSFCLPPLHSYLSCGPET